MKLIQQPESSPAFIFVLSSCRNTGIKETHGAFLKYILNLNKKYKISQKVKPDLQEAIFCF
jgi:hypothetical protein